MKAGKYSFAAAFWGAFYAAGAAVEHNNPALWAVAGGLFFLQFVHVTLVSRKARRERRERAKVPPARQVLQLGAEYGLPVLTGLKKQAVLPPVSIAPAVTAAARASAQSGIWLEDPSEEQRLLRAARDPGPSPEAQAGLSAALLEYMRDQVDEDAVVPRPGYWVMSPEWCEEVLKLRDNHGRAVWEPGAEPATDRAYTLLGHCVGDIGDQYGAPEIVPDVPPRKIEPGYTAIVGPEPALTELRAARAAAWAEAQAALNAGAPVGLKLAQVAQLDRRIRMAERKRKDK